MKNVILIAVLAITVYSCTSGNQNNAVTANSQQFGGDNVDVYSAGVETHGVNPKAIETMKQDGVDISTHTSNNVLEYQGIDFDFVITVCDNAKERCPYFPSNAQKFHHNFPDPSKSTGTENEIMIEFSKVRDIIKLYCKEFIQEHLKLDL